MHDPDDDDDPLVFFKGLYVAFLIMGLFYTCLAIIWNSYVLWASWGG